MRIKTEIKIKIVEGNLGVGVKMVKLNEIVEEINLGKVGF